MGLSATGLITIESQGGNEGPYLLPRKKNSWPFGQILALYPTVSTGVARLFWILLLKRDPEDSLTWCSVHSRAHKAPSQRTDVRDAGKTGLQDSEQSRMFGGEQLQSGWEGLGG